MSKEKRDKRLRLKELRQAKAEALDLLASPRFFNEFLKAVERTGLIGERNNALVVLIVAVSRLFQRPLNLIVKGQSSTGKNWLVTRVLHLMPRDAVREISSTTMRAWNYAKDYFRHRVLYIQERNKAAGEINPARLFISEGKLTHQVTGRRKGVYDIETHVARGPIAAISTTTKDRLEIDDETRHVSIWVDESAEQTRNIVRAYGRYTGLGAHEKLVWRMVHRLLAEHTGIKIVTPAWFAKVADHVDVSDVRARRYFPAFVAACKVVCLIRSYQRRGGVEGKVLTVRFSDFAIAALIFGGVFVESLHRVDGPAFETREAVRRISHRNNGAPIRAQALSKELNISLDRAYEKIRAAVDAGTIRQVNKPERGNLKLYLHVNRPRFIPDPEELFQELEGLGTKVRFVHPLTGKLILYHRRS